MSGHPADRGKGLGSSFYKGVEEFDKGLKFRNGFGNDAIFYRAINYMGSS